MWNNKHIDKSEDRHIYWETDKDLIDYIFDNHNLVVYVEYVSDSWLGLTLYHDFNGESIPIWPMYYLYGESPSEIDSRIRSFIITELSWRKKDK